jgi:hypothetical protein
MTKLAQQHEAKRQSNAERIESEIFKELEFITVTIENLKRKDYLKPAIAGFLSRKFPQLKNQSREYVDKWWKVKFEV